MEFTAIPQIFKKQVLPEEDRGRLDQKVFEDFALISQPQRGELFQPGATPQEKHPATKP